MDVKEKLVVVKENVTPKALAIAGGVTAGIVLGGAALYKLYCLLKVKKFNKAIDDIEEAIDNMREDSFTRPCGPERNISTDSCFTEEDMINAIQFAKASGKQAKIYQSFGKEGSIKLTVDVGADEDLITSYMDFETDVTWKNDHWDKCTAIAKGFPVLINYLFFMKCDEKNWIVVLLQGIDASLDLEIQMEESLSGLTNGIISEYPNILALQAKIEEEDDNTKEDAE